MLCVLFYVADTRLIRYFLYDLATYGVSHALPTDGTRHHTNRCRVSCPSSPCWPLSSNPLTVTRHVTQQVSCLVPIQSLLAALFQSTDCNTPCHTNRCRVLCPFSHCWPLSSNPLTVTRHVTQQVSCLVPVQSLLAALFQSPIPIPKYFSLATVTHESMVKKANKRGLSGCLQVKPLSPNPADFKTKHES